MSAATHVPSSASALLPVERTGRLAGLHALLRRELGQWWRTRLWWTQMLIWVALLNGVTTVVMLTEPTVAGDALVREVTRTFLQMGGTAIPIGVVIVVQGAIVGERELGTAAWVMSKPASRTAFVLAKFVAAAAGFVVTAIAVPAVVFWVEVTFVLSGAPGPWPFLAGLAIVALSVLCYVGLTLALGTVSSGRGPVAGIGVGMVLAGVFFKGMLPPAIVHLTPWLLGDIAAAIAVNGPLDPSWPTPVAATALATVVLAAGAVWRFGRDEL